MARKKPQRKHARTEHGHRRRGGFFGRIFKFFFVLGLWAGLIVIGICAWYAQELPAITRSVTFERKPSITVKAADGSVIARYGEMMGDAVSVKDLPPHLIEAVLAIEDRRFYSHFGVDPIGLIRAVFVNAVEGNVVQGGSTITQQLAKNLFLSPERAYKRKIQEVMLALWLEYELSKDEILSAYLNRVYMGSGTYGVDAAARVYFNKSPSELNLRECATLAGLLKAPSRFSPLNNPTLARERADVVLKAMADAGYISAEEASGLTKGLPRPTQKPSSDGSTARYFADWVVDGLDDLIGTPTEDIIIQTTFNPKIQKSAEEAVQKTIREHGEERNFTQGAVLVMRPNGMVVAMVGGRSYAASQFNRTTQGQRQPGSSFKPIVYLAALERGWRQDDVIYDGKFNEGRYRPENFGDEYFGEAPLWAALMLSMNTATVRLAQNIGPGAVIDTARRLGIISPLEPNLSLALGSSGVSMLELTTAYAVMANGGVSAFPYAINKISSADGQTLYYERSKSSSGRQVIDGYYTYELKSMLRNVVEQGTGQRAQLGYPVYGKTGTSQESRDAWFVGFTDELVAAVWIGNDDNSPMKKVTGGSFPADIWRSSISPARGLYPPITGGDFAFGPSSSGFDNLIGRLVGEGGGETGMDTPAEEQKFMRFGAPEQRAASENLAPRSRYND